MWTHDSEALKVLGNLQMQAVCGGLSNGLMRRRVTCVDISAGTLMDLPRAVPVHTPSCIDRVTNLPPHIYVMVSGFIGIYRRHSQES